VDGIEEFYDAEVRHPRIWLRFEKIEDMMDRYGGHGSI
jgi:hypothetical protein